MKPKRRVAGEGSVFRRQSDGLWVGQACIGGKPRRVYGKAQADVRKALIKLLHERHTGVLVNPARHTVESFLEAWLRDVVEPTTRPTTFASYSSLVRLHITPTLGKILLAKLDPSHVQQWLTGMRKAGRSERLMQYAHDVLRSALAQARRWRLVQVNATDGAARPRADRRQLQVLSPDQVARLLQAAHGTRLEALYTLAVSTGLREGELFGLTWGAVDMEAAVLRVQRQLQRARADSPAALVEPKTPKARRPVELPAIAVKALRAHRVRQAAERLALGPEWRNAWNLVLVDETGAPLDVSNVRRDFRRLLARAELPLIRFHDLRHSAATLLLAAGEHPKVVSERLGHYSVAFTMDTYCHVLPSMQRAAADKIDALLAAAGGE